MSPFLDISLAYRTDSGIKQAEISFHRGLIRDEIPVYNSLLRTAFALARMAEYHAFQRGSRHRILH
jgi:hypothetical protein